MQKLSRIIANSSLIFFPAGILGVKYLSGATFLIVILTGFVQIIVSYKSIYQLTKNEKLLFFSVSFLTVTTFVVAYFANTNMGRANLFVGLIMVVPIYIFFRKNLNTDAYLWYGLIIGAFIGLCVSIYQVYVITSFDNRAAGATNAIIFGDLALLLGVLSIAGFTFFRLKYENRWWLFLPVLALFSGLYASVLSMSRGGWVAIPFLSLVFIWFFSRHLSVKKMVAIFTLLVLSISIIYVVPQTGFQKRVVMTTNNIDRYFESREAIDPARGTSIGSRFEMLKAGWIIFKEHPFVGVGWGEYKKHTQILVDEGLVHPAAVVYVHPHNQFISSLSKGGLLGFSGTLILFLFPAIIFYRVIKDNSNLELQHIGLAGLVLIVAFVIFNMSESFLERTRTVMFFSFYLAAFMAVIQRHRQK